MLKLLAGFVVLLAAGLAAYAYRDLFLPASSAPASMRGSPTPLQDRRVPGFSLPGLVGRGVETRDFLTARRPIVVKFWGSWSPACILEYPLLMELASSRVEMWAIAFRDNRTNALDYLERNGNPYARVALDEAGRVAADWGVSSAPATFLVDGEGIVRWARGGPLTPQILSRELYPMLQRWAP